jgi:hypothetical protein
VLLGPKRHEELGDVCQSRAAAWRHAGGVPLHNACRDGREAEPLAKRVLTIREKALGPDHVDVASSLNNLALLHDDQRQYDQAESLYKQAQAISQKAFGPDHPAVARRLHNLAFVYRSLNNVDRDEAYRQIQDTVSMGVVLPPSASGRGAVYRPARTLAQTLAWLEERVPALQVFFKTHDRLTNSDYRDIFSLTRYAAARELRQLTGEGFLVMEGERRGARCRPSPLLKMG